MMAKRVFAAGLMFAAVTPCALAQSGNGQFTYSTAQMADGVDWSGVYAGIHTGGVSGKTTFVRQTAANTSPNSPAGAFIAVSGGCCGTPIYASDLVNNYRRAEIGINRTVDIEGYHIGPHVGYQKQFGQMVLGADLGFSLGGGDGKKDCSNPGAAAISVLCESEYKYSVNARARLGYATGNYLFYSTAGLVRAKIENTVTYSLPGFSMKESGTAYPNGYLLGLGLEYQAANGMRFGLGYTHILLEKVNVSLQDGYGGGSGTRSTHDPDVLGGSLRIPLQQQAPAVQDPGPPAAQAPAIAQAQVAPAARPAPAAAPAAGPGPAAAPAPAAVRRAPAAAPGAAPAPVTTAPVPGAPVPTLPPAAATPVPGQPVDPAEPVVKNRPSK